VNNEELFQRLAKDIVRDAVAGYNGTIFAYGMTAAGKTFTMLGDKANPGILVQAINEIRNAIAEVSTIFRDVRQQLLTQQHFHPLPLRPSSLQSPDKNFLIRVSYLEIYQETVRDLLQAKTPELKIHEDEKRVSRRPRQERW
jgi:centromeric protein E